MCGIYGQINRERPVDKDVLAVCTDTLTRRGPDSSGYFVKDNIGLGYRRLAIIDLSSAGDQPMFNKDKSLGLVFNGEIYNYLDIKKNLSKE